MITRKEFLSTTGAGLASAMSPAPQGTRRTRPKNVLFLLSDQHHPRAMSWTGHAHARTPNLDALARSGTAFESAYCANPVCAPSRASILTGLYTHHHNTLKNDVPWPPNIPTMAHHFSRAGYASALIGKAHFADGQTHGFDYRLDFNEWFQYLGPKTQLYADELPAPNGGCGFPQVYDLWESGDPWKETRKAESRETMATGRPSPMEERDHFDSWVARESVRFLRTYAGKQPLFLIASFLKPHGPFSPPPRFIDPDWKRSIHLPRTHGKVDLASVPKLIRDRIAKADATLHDPEKALLRLAMYYACIAHLDQSIGEVMRALEEAGLSEDTLVVYSSDHGDMCGEHGMWDKFVFYEASAGVPLILRVPGVTQGGAVSGAPVSQVALLPTLLELCGLPVPGGLDETSLVPFLREPGRRQSRPVFSEFQMGGKAERYMIRRGDWKYCHYLADTPELYNLRDDPEEMRNLATAAAHADVTERMKEEVLAWRARVGA
jgi:choline-sulfatase